MTQRDAAIGLRNMTCRYVVHQHCVADPGKHSFASVEIKRRVTALENMRSCESALHNGDCIGFEKENTLAQNQTRVGTSTGSSATMPAKRSGLRDAASTAEAAPIE